MKHQIYVWQQEWYKYHIYFPDPEWEDKKDEDYLLDQPKERGKVVYLIVKTCHLFILIYACEPHWKRI